MPKRIIKIIKHTTESPKRVEVELGSKVLRGESNDGLTKAVEDWVNERRENGRKERSDSEAVIAAWNVIVPTP